MASPIARVACSTLLCGALAGACGEPVTAETPEPSEHIGKVSSALTVDQAIASGCSTTSVLGLSQQIVDEVNCLVPNAYAMVPDRPNLTKGGAVFPFLQTPARDGLVAALDASPGMSMTVNSMLRTVAQQYLLYAWYQSGTCGIGLAATPGTSNHEQGTAFDTSDHAAWESELGAHGWTPLGASDPVHFDFTGPGTTNLKGKDILAFQKLWNLNNPTDTIGEDGAYGPMTEARLKASPADGFAKGPSCSGGPGAGGAGPGAGGAGPGPGGAGPGAGGSTQGVGGTGASGKGGAMGTGGNGGAGPGAGVGGAGAGAGAGAGGAGPGVGAGGSTMGASGTSGQGAAGASMNGVGGTTGAAGAQGGASGGSQSGGKGGVPQGGVVEVPADSGSSGSCSVSAPRGQGAPGVIALALGALLVRRARRRARS